VARGGQFTGRVVFLIWSERVRIRQGAPEGQGETLVISNRKKGLGMRNWARKDSPSCSKKGTGTCRNLERSWDREDITNIGQNRDGVFYLSGHHSGGGRTSLHERG